MEKQMTKKQMDEEIKRKFLDGDFIWQIARDLKVSEQRVVLCLLDSGLYHPGEGL